MMKFDEKTAIKTASWRDIRHHTTVMARVFTFTGSQENSFEGLQK
jgi:hypothetical protein